MNRKNYSKGIAPIFLALVILVGGASVVGVPVAVDRFAGASITPESVLYPIELAGEYIICETSVDAVRCYDSVASEKSAEALSVVATTHIETAKLEEANAIIRSKRISCLALSPTALTDCSVVIDNCASLTDSITKLSCINAVSISAISAT